MSSILVQAIPDGARLAKFASTQLLKEWADFQVWDWGPKYEMRLGPTPLVGNPGVVDDRYEGALRRFCRYADLIGAMHGELYVVEAKMRAEPGAISQLQHYVDLVLATPAIRMLPYRRVHPLLLWALDVEEIHQRAVAAGVDVEVYTPPWVNDWLAIKYAKTPVSAP
jgi:hypothetical protein